jgi:hypothetical protein
VVGRAWAWFRDRLFLLLGVATIGVGLGIVAAVPILGLAALGYILEAAARVARGGRFRDGFPGIRRIARIGACALGTLIVSLPLIICDSLRRDEALIFAVVANRCRAQAVAIPPAVIEHHRRFELVTLALLVVTALHVAGALARAATLGAFFRPIKNGVFLLGCVVRPARLGEAVAAAVVWVRELGLGHLFSLGARGFVAAAVWLALPTALLAAGRAHPLLGIAGGLALVPVLAWLPFLQVRLAVEDRFAAAFDVGEIRARRRRAPLAHAFAVFVTLLLALPLYLLKVEQLPRDVLWLAAIVFVALVLPAKLLVGKAYARGSARPASASLWLRAACGHVEVPMIALYVVLLFLTQFIDWRGAYGLFEHHAFMLPTAFY